MEPLGKKIIRWVNLVKKIIFKTIKLIDTLEFLRDIFLLELLLLF